MQNRPIIPGRCPSVSVSGKSTSVAGISHADSSPRAGPCAQPNVELRHADTVRAATLGAAYALAGRADEARPLVADAIEGFRSRPAHIRPARTRLARGRPTSRPGGSTRPRPRPRGAGAHPPSGSAGREAYGPPPRSAISRRPAAPRTLPKLQGHYREALALAGELGMRPLVAHCHLGLGKLYRRTGDRGEGPRAPDHRDDDVPRDGHGLLAGEGRRGAARSRAMTRVVSVVMLLVALAAPLAAQAQPAVRTYQVGLLAGGSPPSHRAPLTAALRELGYVEGQNLLIESRYAEGRPELAQPCR